MDDRTIDGQATRVIEAVRVYVQRAKEHFDMRLTALTRVVLRSPGCTEADLQEVERMVMEPIFARLRALEDGTCTKGVDAALDANEVQRDLLRQLDAHTRRIEELERRALPQEEHDA